MCLSTHEMNSSRIESEIAGYRKLLDSGTFAGRPLTEYEKASWTWRVGELEKLLKERADAGTYSDDFEAEAYR